MTYLLIRSDKNSMFLPVLRIEMLCPNRMRQNNDEYFNDTIQPVLITEVVPRLSKDPHLPDLREII